MFAVVFVPSLVFSVVAVEAASSADVEDHSLPVKSLQFAAVALVAAAAWLRLVGMDASDAKAATAEILGSVSLCVTATADAPPPLKLRLAAQRLSELSAGYHMQVSQHSSKG